MHTSVKIINYLTLHCRDKLLKTKKNMLKTVKKQKFRKTCKMKNKRVFDIIELVI